MIGADASTAAGPISVLLVEDDAGDALLVEELLARFPDEFKVNWVRTLAQALAAVAGSVDCVLLDLGLPDTEGLDALRAIVGSDESPAVVVLTGLADRSRGSTAMELGAQDYLAKGAVDEESLARALRYAVVRRRGEDANRRLREADLLQREKARLERGLLPHALISNPRLSWVTCSEPGGGRALLGGDFFDVVELPDGTVRAMIGDVAGHGPDEAALGVALRVGWRALVLAGQSPTATLVAVERLLAVERASDEVFATIFDLELAPDLRSAIVRTAGHPNPLLLAGDKISEATVGARRPPLGVAHPSAWVPSTLELPPEWTLVAFTDGLIEGRNGLGDRLGTEGLAELATEATEGARTLADVSDRLIALAERANGASLRDDVALVLLSTSERWNR
jgi:serine phosphatase RsbU (regulator of sigma subunit)